MIVNFELKLVYRTFKPHPTNSYLRHRGTDCRRRYGTRSRPRNYHKLRPRCAQLKLSLQPRTLQPWVWCRAQRHCRESFHCLHRIHCPRHRARMMLSVPYPKESLARGGARPSELLSARPWRHGARSGDGCCGARGSILEPDSDPNSIDAWPWDA